MRNEVMKRPDRHVKDNEIRHGEKLARGNPEDFWGWGTPAGQQRARRRAAMITERANLGPGRLALEIGCGTGLFTEWFAQSGASIIAVDVSGVLIAKARERDLPAHRIHFVEGAFEECRLEGPFDAVIGSSVLHHLQVETSIRKIFGLLKPGGVMSFTEPNMLNPQILLQKNIPWLKRRLGDSPDETAFYSWRMRTLLKTVGFVDIEVYPFDWLHPAVPPSWIDPVTRLGEILEKTFFLREFAGSLHISAKRPERIARS